MCLHLHAQVPTGGGKHSERELQEGVHGPDGDGVPGKPWAWLPQLWTFLLQGGCPTDLLQQPHGYAHGRACGGHTRYLSQPSQPLVV